MKHNARLVLCCVKTRIKKISQNNVKGVFKHRLYPHFSVLNVKKASILLLYISARYPLLILHCSSLEMEQFML